MHIIQERGLQSEEGEFASPERERPSWRKLNFLHDALHFLHEGLNFLHDPLHFLHEGLNFLHEALLASKERVILL